VLAGAVIAAAGLTFGSLSAANALPGHHLPSLSIQQAGPSDQQTRCCRVTGGCWRPVLAPRAGGM
jgi:hypothetical protein